jgi:predicted DNA-binding transcriptional regulator AlpA
MATVTNISTANATPAASGHRFRELLTPDQVAAWLGVSKAWVIDHATRRKPQIPVVRFGEQRGLLRFRPQDIEEFIASHLSARESV